MARTTSTDVIAVIEHQHEEVKRLLTAIASAPSEDDFCELRRMIAVHETAEEEVIYPVLRGEGEKGRSIVSARSGEEAEGIKVLAALEKLDVGTREFQTMFEKFGKAVLNHAEAEESTVLPLLRSSQTPERLEQMAESFDIAARAAPTHPHPHKGTSAASNVIVGPFLAIADRVRDALHAVG